MAILDTNSCLHAIVASPGLCRRPGSGAFIARRSMVLEAWTQAEIV